MTRVAMPPIALLSRFVFVTALATIALAARAADTGALVHEGIVAAPPDRVWAAFTTREGQEAWMVAHAQIDLRVGGLMRTHYDPKGTLGDAGTIENTILAFEPARMITLQVSRPPERFPFPAEVRRMWTVVYFTPEGPAGTRVRIAGLGFDDGEGSQKMRAFFDRGNAFTLRKLQEHFAAPVAAPREEAR